MAQKTIKLSELNALRAKAAQAEQFDTEAGMWCRHTLKLMREKDDLRNKIWAAEQEIHDLKYDLEREKNENDLATDHWAERVAEQNEEIHDLKHDLEFAQNLADDAIRSNTEQIDPPACLKPFDALNYICDRAFPNVSWSGPY